MEDLRMVVEIPTGSANKYEFNTLTREWELDRVLYGAMFYPCEYGFIPNTIDYDGDPLDVLCLVSYPTFPGCTIAVRVIGVLRMIDQGDYDYKLIAVNASDSRFQDVKNLEDLGRGKLAEISNFFLRYKELEKKEVIIKGYGNQEEAHEILTECSKMFSKYRPVLGQMTKKEIISLLKKEMESSKSK